MKRYESIIATVVILLVCVSSLPAQSSKTSPVTIVFAKLLTSLDSKTSAIGDEVSFTTINDITVDGTIVIPQGSKLIGHVAGVISRGKEEPKSVIAIAIDKAISKGADVPLQAIIAAIAAPSKALSDDPTYTMMHSNEPKMAGSGVTGVTTSGSLPASSKATSTATVATAQIKGSPEEPVLLNEDSQGAIGYEDVAISWHLTIPPPLTIFATRGKRLKLEAGSQVLLRVMTPKISN
ncbi:MAG TPA: hypothetical protein VGJ69_05715 [Pyrinomonadaceae bacterium]